MNWPPSLEAIQAVAEISRSVVEVIAIVIGGVWALYRFELSRSRETALEIDLDYECLPADKGFIVWLKPTFKNKGEVKVAAKGKMHHAYQDGVEDLRYSVDLLWRPLSRSVDVGSQIGWFAQEGKSPRPQDLEFDLAADYADEGETDFWIEPGEKYQLGAIVVAKPGLYLVMVTFVGDKNDREFWRRLFVVSIPKSEA